MESPVEALSERHEHVRACKRMQSTFIAPIHLHLPRAHHGLRNRSAAHESASALAHALACYDLYLEQQSINRNNTNVLLLLSYRLLRVWACDCHIVTSLSQYFAWPALCLRCLSKAAYSDAMYSLPSIFCLRRCIRRHLRAQHLHRRARLQTARQQTRPC
jgi:hypothetical protein